LKKEGKMRNLSIKKLFPLFAVTLFVLVIAMLGTAAAKGLFVCSEHHYRQFDVWDIAPDGTITKVATYSLAYATDPAGITIDTVDPHTGTIIFITSEFSPGIEIVEVPPVGTPRYIGRSDGPSNLAGIDIDDVNDIVYAVRRHTNELYIYKWDSGNETLTLLTTKNLPGLLTGYGLALDEIAGLLYIADPGSGLVRVYDVNTLTEVSNFAPSIPPVGIAVDRQRGLVYTTHPDQYCAWLPQYGGYTLLSKYELATGTETTVNMGHGGMGIAVDEVTGYVYVTEGCSGDRIRIFDSNLATIGSTGDIGRPAGLAIANVIYNPLNLAKNDVVVGYGVYIGQTFTYEITYDNKNNIFEVTNVTAVDTLPPELDFVSETLNGVPGTGIYDPVAHTVTWNIGTLPAGYTGGLIELVVRVNEKAVGETTIYNYCTIDSDQTGPTTVIGEDPDAPAGEELGTYIIPVITVAIDVKPQSCPNPLNVGAKGVLPVAILGTEDFDVSQVDPTTIVLYHEEGKEVSPTRWAMEDVATPFEPFTGREDALDCTEEGADGYLDLTLKFDTQEIVEAIGEVEDGEVIVLTLTGNLHEEFGGTPIKGEDVVVILKRGKK
jgi:uncharacterized repeat protein (TIGR01451 family)